MSLDSPSDKQVETTEEVKSLRDNLGLQALDYTGSCERIRFEKEFPKFYSMQATAEFEPWQVTAVDWIYKEFKARVRAAIVADAMGLGKTCEYLGFIVWCGASADTSFSSMISRLFNL